MRYLKRVLDARHAVRDADELVNEPGISYEEFEDRNDAAWEKVDELHAVIRNWRRPR